MALRVLRVCWLFLFIAGCGGGGGGGTTLVAEWPRFRGDDLNSGGNLSLASSTGNLKAGFPLRLDGTPISATVTSGPSRRFVVATESGNVYERNHDGTPIWQFTAASGVRSSPSVDGQDRVYFGTEAGRFYGVGNDGKEMWHYDAGGGAIRSSALLEFDSVEGRLAAVFFGTSGGSLVAIGGLQDVPGLLWRFDAGSAITSSPASEGVNLYFSANDGNLYALTHDHAPAFPRPVPFGGINPGLCLGGAHPGQICAADAECAPGTCDRTATLLASPSVGFANSVFQAGTTADGRGVVIGVTSTGIQQWRVTLPASVIGTPAHLLTAGSNAVAANQLIVADDTGALYAIDQGVGAVCMGGENNGVSCVDDTTCGDGSCAGPIYTADAPVVASVLAGSEGTIVMVTAPSDGTTAKIIAVKVRICLSGKAEGRFCRSDFDCPGAAATDPFGACDPAGFSDFTQPRWVYPPADSTVIVGPMRSSPGATTLGEVYVGSDDGNVYAIAGSNG